MRKRTYEAGASAYTLGIVNGVLDYAYEYGKESKVELENMPDDACVDEWKDKLEEIAEEFICTPRYFLMCWLAAECLHKNLLGSEMKLGEFPAFQYKPKGARKAKDFKKVTREHARSLGEEELKQYIEVFTKIAWENEKPEDEENADIKFTDENEKEKGLRPYKLRNVFRQAFLWYLRSRRLLTKEEGLQIAHMIRLNYEETCYFLVRAVENDGLDFTKSVDIIHAYCLLRGKSYGVFGQLKTEYETMATGIKKVKPEEKPEGFTAGMLPGCEVSGRNDDPGRLYERICQWEDEVISQALDKNSEENEIKADDPKKKDSVDEKFLTWLVSQAEYLDIPGKSALTLFRNLTAYVYHYTLEHDIRKRGIYSVSGDGEFLKNFPEETKRGKEPYFEDSTGNPEPEDLLEDLDEVAVQNTGKCEFDQICSMDSPYQLKEELEKKDYEILVLNRLVPLLDKLSERRIFEAKHMTRIMRYMQVAPNGELESATITKRVSSLLAGEIPVTKADMLFMVWLVCNVYQETKREDEMSVRVWDFLKGGSKVLEEGHLPELYVPHVLERTFILSLCIGNLLTEERDTGVLVYMDNPIQVYLTLSAYINSPLSRE